MAVGALLLVLAIGALVLANISFDFDHWAGVTANLSPQILRFVSFPELRSISISLTAAFISILVFLPALISIAKSQEENLLLTVIERQYIAALGDVSSILFIAFVGSVYSVLILLAISYFLVGVQAFLLVVLLIIVFLKLWKALVLAKSTRSTFIAGAIRELEEEMREISNDVEKRRRLSHSFEKSIDKMSSRKGLIPVTQSLYLPSQYQATVEVSSDKRIRSINIKPCIGFLNEKLFELADGEDRFDDSGEEKSKFRIRVRDPFQYDIGGTNVPILSIQKQRATATEIDLSSLAESASQILQTSVRFENIPKFPYEQTKRLIIEDFENSLLERNVQRIRRNFELLDGVVAGNKSRESKHRESLLFSLASGMAEAVFLAGDAYMLENTPRRLVLSNVYKIIRHSARNDYWFMLDRFGGAVRSLFVNEIRGDIARSRMPIRLLQSEIRTLALFHYELVWVLRRSSETQESLEPFYARQVFEVFRILIDWVSRADLTEHAESVEELLKDCLKLLDRYFTSSDRDTLDVRVGGLVLLSLQSYILFNLANLESGDARRLIKMIFRDHAPQDFAQIAQRAYSRQILDDLHWDHWKLEDIGFEGGYVFSASNYYASCALVYWIVTGNNRWIRSLPVEHLSYLRRAFGDDGWTAIDEILDVESAPRIVEISEMIETRQQTEYEEIVGAKPRKSTIDDFFVGLKGLLRGSKFITAFKSVEFQASEAIQNVELFSLEMPKRWFVVGTDEFPLEPDGVVQRGIERRLFSRFLDDIEASVTEVDEESDQLPIGTDVLIFTNFPDIGFDPFDRRARELFGEEGQSTAYFNFKSRKNPGGIWVVRRNDIAMQVAASQDEGWNRIAPLIFAKLEFIDDRARARLKFSGRFQVKPNKSILRLVKPATI